MTVSRHSKLNRIGDLKSDFRPNRGVFGWPLRSHLFRAGDENKCPLAPRIGLPHQEDMITPAGSVPTVECALVMGTLSTLNAGADLHGFA